MLATEIIFPSHAKDLFLSSMAQTMDDLSQLYLAVSVTFVLARFGSITHMLTLLLICFAPQMSR